MTDVELLLPGRRDVRDDDLFDLYDDPGPHVRAGVLLSLDGATSAGGRSAPLQTSGDTRVFGALRAVSDAVLVGAGTVRAEAYGPVWLPSPALVWRCEHGRDPHVPLVVVSRSLDLALDASWLQEGGPLVLTCATAPAQRLAQLSGVAEMLVCGDREVDLRAAVTLLAARGLSRLLCEGGPSLFGDLVRARVLTEVCATVSPRFVGAAEGVLHGALPEPVDLTLVHLLHDAGTLLGRWELTGG